jgi:NADH pyrophosphatase NudC (nudix superfamily)
MMGGRSRLACSASDCRFVHWNNPTPVVAGLVRWRGGYLLARGTGWPAGVFSFLTGFLEEGEAPEAAVIREVREELGLAAASAELVGHFPFRQMNQLIIAYSVPAVGEVSLGEELVETRLLPADELAGFDFGPLELTREIVHSWLSRPSSR